MISASPRSAVAPQFSEPARPQARPAVDPLDGDRLDYDAWLLPPLEVDRTERLVRAVSWAAGPVALLATILLVAPMIF